MILKLISRFAFGRFRFYPMDEKTAYVLDAFGKTCVTKYAIKKLQAVGFEVDVISTIPEDYEDPKKKSRKGLVCGTKVPVDIFKATLE